MWAILYTNDFRKSSSKAISLSLHHLSFWIKVTMHTMLSSINLVTLHKAYPIDLYTPLWRHLNQYLSHYMFTTHSNSDFVGILPLACKNSYYTLQIFVHWFTILVIFVVTSYAHALNVKVILTVIRSIGSKPTPTQSFCFYSFYNFLILVDLCLTFLYIPYIYLSSFWVLGKSWLIELTHFWWDYE